MSRINSIFRRNYFTIDLLYLLHVPSHPLFILDFLLHVWSSTDDNRGQDWTEGQGNGERIGPKVGEEEEVKYDALGNPIAAVKKEKKKSAAELRKAKKERIARRKRGEEVFTDEEL